MSHGSTKRSLFIALTLQIAAITASAAMKDIPHPFLLWTKEEAADLRKKMDTDPLVKQQYENMVKKSAGGKTGNSSFINLFKYMVLEDQVAGETEKKALLSFIGQVPEPLTEKFQADIRARIEAAGGDTNKIWARGGASFGDRHMRDEQSMNIIRYDIFYDQLTPEQREGLEKSFNTYIQFHLDGHRPWHADFSYGKMSWLPNMSWPRAIGTHLMAVGLKDEKKIAAMFNSTGGWKWFFDEYVSDGRFYNEEFCKYYSNIGTMALYCRGLERLGLGQYGWNYTGKSGASMKRFLMMYPDITYPRTEIPGGMANWRIVSMGDARGVSIPGLGVSESSFIRGYLPSGVGGDGWWSGSHMNGPFPKAQAPLWMEWGHATFPDSGCDYVLAQMRKPGESTYLPSLFFGVGPIDPAKVKPPTPCPSYLAYERGFAFLRMDETPSYWEGPAPALSQQFGFYYAHYAHDCFAMLGYQAFNRPIYINTGFGSRDTKHYINEHILSGPPSGYIARHPWLDTVRGYAGVIVNNLQARPVESGEEGLKNHTMRFSNHPPVKYVSGRTKGVYPDVDMERAHFLTMDYDFDVFWVNSDRKCQYDWQVIGPGLLQYDKKWKPTSELNGSMLYRPMEGDDARQPDGYEDKLDPNDLGEVHKTNPSGDDWSTTILQVYDGSNIEKSVVGKAWYDRNIGVKLTMLGEKGTTVFGGRAPGSISNEFGGAVVIVRRETPGTVFAALHQPFVGGPSSNAVEKFERIDQNPSGVAVSIVGKAGSGIDDRIVYRYGDAPEKPAKFAGDGESFTVGDHAWIRIGKAGVEAWGSITQLSLKVEGNPPLMLNGRKVDATVKRGVLNYIAPASQPGT